MRDQRMTLLLGPPASGKSTLLLALAGKLDPQLKVTLPLCALLLAFVILLCMKTALIILHNQNNCFSCFCFFLFFFIVQQKSGEVTYNGTALDEFCVQRTSAYISQTDNHLGELTVRETLDFAAKCQGASENWRGWASFLVLYMP